MPRPCCPSVQVDNEGCAVVGHPLLEFRQLESPIQCSTCFLQSLASGVSRALPSRQAGVAFASGGGARNLYVARDLPALPQAGRPVGLPVWRRALRLPVSWDVTTRRQRCSWAASSGCSSRSATTWAVP